MINQGSEMREPISVKVADFARMLNLDIIYDGDSEEVVFSTVNINRPGIVLAGYAEYFGHHRVQVMGNAEIMYILAQEPKVRREKLEFFFSQTFPCLIIGRGMSVPEDFLEIARLYHKPVLVSQQITTNLVNDLVMYLNDLLAPVANIHGTLLDVYGVGILLTGDSGMGKSETALELIKRGHRLVADDAVIVKNVRNVITGSAPEMIKFLMEIRGIGIINVRNMYGVGAVSNHKEIELVIHLERWDTSKQYDRIGDMEEYEEILDASIPKIDMPVIPGRNLAIIVEAAARNHRVKQKGYSARDELENRRRNLFT